MSNFWQTKLGVPAALVPQPQLPPTSPPTRAWWDDRPLPAPQPQMAPQVQQQQYTEPPRQAKSARQNTLCPECGSNDYMAVAQDGPSIMTGPARARCFSCGYPYMQQGSRGIGIKGQGDVTASRQPHDGSSQVIPGFITHIQ